MSLHQTLYFMSLAGGMAGLFSWTLVRLIAAVVPPISAVWFTDVLSTAILGGFIGGMTVAFTDKWSSGMVVGRWVFSGTIIGILAGLLAGVIQIPITENLGDQAPLLTRVIAWMLAGSLIGLGVGLRWVAVNRMRAVHAFAGGLLGGAVGGLLFAALGTLVADLSLALCYVLTGVGICFGITFAPILLRDGLLQFISSGDAVAQSKLGHTHKEWEISDGDAYGIGSQSHDLSSTRYRPEVEIFIPDAAIAARHAQLYSRDRRFYLRRHQEVSGDAGMARYVLKVRGRNVSSSTELRDNDDILVGRTALRFITRKKSN